MGALVVLTILAAGAVGSVLRGHLTVDGQYSVVFIALGALVLLFVVAGYVSAICDQPVSWHRSVGRS